MAITNNKLDGGIETRWTETGPSTIISGRELVGSITIGAAVAGITPEVFLGGAWTPLAVEITSDTQFMTFGGPTLRDYQFRFNCTSYTSGTPQVNWDVG